MELTPHIRPTVEHRGSAKPQIAVVSRNTLAARGLVSLIESIMPVVEVCIFHDFSSLSAVAPDRFFHFFITTEVLLQDPAFFTARSRRTILIIEGRASAQIPRCFKTIDATLGESDLLRAFLQMEQHAHSGGKLMPQQVRRETQRKLEVDVLTPREREVLREIVSGHINKEIADRLNIGLTTVISHRRNIMEKLHAKSVSALTVYAVMHGIVSVDSI